jgi:hypothetical protein
MAEDDKQQGGDAEPSMEDILASIRKILSEEEQEEAVKAEKPAAAAPEPAPKPAPKPAPEPEIAMEDTEPEP